MVEDKGEAEQRAELQKTKAKWTSAADSLTDLVRKFAIEEANDESGHMSDEHEHDSGYGHGTPTHDSPIPTPVAPVSDHGPEAIFGA